MKKVILFSIIFVISILIGYYGYTASSGLTTIDKDAISQYEAGLKHIKNGKVAKAYNVFNKSAVQGYAPAQYRLALIYFPRKSKTSSPDWDITKLNSFERKINNEEKSNRWLIKSSNQNYAPAQSELGERLLPKKTLEALELLEKAANKGELSAQIALAYSYKDGYIVEKNVTEAIKWFELAVAQGDADSSNILKWLKANPENIATQKQVAQQQLTENLVRASAKGKLDEVKLYLKKGATINSKNKNGYSALHKASYKGHDAIVKYLLSKGAFVDIRDSSGATPLLLSVSFYIMRKNNNLTAIKLLLEHGADIKARDSLGDTPIKTVQMVSILNPEALSNKALLKIFTSKK